MGLKCIKHVLELPESDQVEILRQHFTIEDARHSVERDISGATAGFRDRFDLTRLPKTAKAGNFSYGAYNQVFEDPQKLTQPEKI